MLALGTRAADWLAARMTIGTRTLVAVQFLVGVYGGYFGGVVGLIMMAMGGLLAGLDRTGSLRTGRLRSPWRMRRRH